MKALNNIYKIFGFCLIVGVGASLWAQETMSNGASVDPPGEAEPEKELWHKLYFETAKWLIDAGDESVVKEIATWLQDNPKASLLVEGHTDNVGGYKYNQNLSYKRATTVQQAIAAEGIDIERISIAWYGYTKPAGPNSTAAEKQQNRRVEIFKVTIPPPAVDVQDFVITYGENDKFDVIITYECSKFESFYGDWKKNCKVLNKGAEKPAIKDGALKISSGVPPTSNTAKVINKKGTVKKPGKKIIYMDEKGNIVPPPTEEELKQLTVITKKPEEVGLNPDGTPKKKK